MNKKCLLAVAAIAILDALLHPQFQHWRSFDWIAFWSQTQGIHKWRVLYAVTMIYFAYFLRAVRWKLFLIPTRPQARVLGLLSSTLVGFTGLALLGRAGEFIRPFLIARREKLPVSSQFATWAVERIFDVGSFAVLMLLAIFLPSALSSIPHPEYYRHFQQGGFLLVGAVAAVTAGAIIVSRMGNKVACWVEIKLSNPCGRLSSWVSSRSGWISELRTQLRLPARLGLAVLVALRIVLAYLEVAHSNHFGDSSHLLSLMIRVDYGTVLAAIFSLLCSGTYDLALVFSQKLAILPRSTAMRVNEFGKGLKTIHGPISLLCLVLVSVGMWYVIALAYKEVTHSYGMDPLEIPISQILILMGASMVGSMLQLPAVGGGSQMATIAALSVVFDVPAEMAASCGILLWLVTFAAVIPAGLLIAHRERLSLRTLSTESHQPEGSA